MHMQCKCRLGATDEGSGWELRVRPVLGWRRLEIWESGNPEIWEPVNPEMMDLNKQKINFKDL